jgi:glycosyltransferase involved in cell wall biosynthesis
MSVNLLKKRKGKAIILTIGPNIGEPWHWKYVSKKKILCNLKYERVSIGSKKESGISIIDVPQLIIKIIKILMVKKPNYIFTFECGWTSTIVSMIQTFGIRRQSKHIILQFIMREKESNYKSKIKYLIMRAIFSSIFMAVCSARGEAEYYQKVFKWENRKAIFVPCFTDIKFLNTNMKANGKYILSAGRTFRDYDTLLEAAKGIDKEIIIVAGKGTIDEKRVAENVTVKYDIPIDELTEMIEESLFLVIPLEERKISIGQSVFLQAMAMGKGVIVTKTIASADYIENMNDGILVKAKDVNELRRSMIFLLENENIRKRLGEKARKKIMENHIPQKYIERIAREIRKKELNEGVIT